MNRRAFLAGSIGLAAAAPVMAKMPDRRQPKQVKPEPPPLRLYREPFFHTPFDHVTEGGMALGELCYLVGQDMTGWWEKGGVMSIDPNMPNRILHDLPNHLLKMNANKSWHDYRKIMLVTTGGHHRWVTSINDGATFMFFKSLAAVRLFAYENGLFALVDGTFAEHQEHWTFSKCCWGDIRVADFVIEAQPPSMHLLKNRYGPKETVHFG